MAMGSLSVRHMVTMVLFRSSVDVVVGFIFSYFHGYVRYNGCFTLSWTCHAPKNAWNCYTALSDLQFLWTPGRENLLSLGTRLGKLSKKGKFRLHITALTYLAPYAKVLLMTLLHHWSCQRYVVSYAKPRHVDVSALPWAVSVRVSSVVVSVGRHHVHKWTSRDILMLSWRTHY